MPSKLLLLALSIGLMEANAVEYFGIATVVGDGFEAVGAPFENGGAVYVYTNGQKTRIANPTGEIGHWFGCSLALAGNTLVVGARGADNNRGAVYLYNRAGTEWKMQQKLSATDILESFGITVAASGGTIAVGASGADRAKGAVYIYTFADGVWKPQQRFAASNGAPGDALGIALALERDTLVAGAGHKRKIPNDRKTTNTGAAYVFVRTGGAFREMARLLSPGGLPSFEFGTAVGLSGDTVMIGEHRRGNEPGGVHIFVRAGDVWNHRQILRPHDNSSSDSFGLGIAVDGETLVVGARRKDSELGAAYVYSGKGAEWRELQKLVAPDRGKEDTTLNSPERFGEAVAVRGGKIAIGAPERNKTTGAAYAFTRTGAKWDSGTLLKK